MDPNIFKLLEEDEDETMHSEANVEAFAAELKREIEGNYSIPQQPSDSNAAALSQGSCETMSQRLPQWHTHANLESGLDLVAIGEKEQHCSELELQRQCSDPWNRKEGDHSSLEPNPLLPNPSIVARSQLHNDRNTFPLPQSVGGQPSGEHPISVQALDHDAKPDKELQINKLQSVSHHPSMAVGSNDQQPLAMEFSDQQILPTTKGNQQTNMGINNDGVMPSPNHHTTGMAKTCQQTVTSGISSWLELNKTVRFSMLLPFIQPHIDKDRAMQLRALLQKLKKEEISKNDFLRHLKSMVGHRMLQIAVYQLQAQARNSQTATNQFQSLPQMQLPAAQLPKDISNSMSDNNDAKSREEDRQADSHEARATSSSGAISHEMKQPAFPTQGLNKQHHMHFSQASYPSYGSPGSGYPTSPVTSAVSSAAIQPQAHDSQMRQAASHPSLTVNQLGPTSQPLNVTNMSTFNMPHSLNNLKKKPVGSLTRMNYNTALQQNQVKCQSSTSKEQKTSISPSMSYKQGPSDRSNEQQKAQLSTSHELSSLPPGPSKRGSAASCNLMDRFSEIQSSRTGLTQPTTLVPSNSVSPSPSLMGTNILSSTRLPSLTAPVGPGNSSKAPPRIPLIGQKKPMEAPGSSPPSSKRPKVSGSFVDQSIEHLNDVTAVSGVNLREEEELLFSCPKEDSQVSEAFRQVLHDEEERLILKKIPLQKKMIEIMARYGLKTMSKDVERCLSLCVEERLHGLISNAIRFSKQRADIEKPRHKIVITSDLGQQSMGINCKTREEWEKKQAETEKSKKTEGSTGIDADKEKDDSRGKLMKVNKMRTAAANAAVRAATGTGDITSRWKLMVEAKQKQGGCDTSSATSTRNTKENRESEKLGSSITLTTPVRKVGRNQVVVRRVGRRVSVKDVVAVLERESQMSKSTLLYRLYQKVSADSLTK